MKYGLLFFDNILPTNKKDDTIIVKYPQYQEKPIFFKQKNNQCFFNFKPREKIDRFQIHNNKYE